MAHLRCSHRAERRRAAFSSCAEFTGANTPTTATCVERTSENIISSSYHKFALSSARTQRGRSVNIHITNIVKKRRSARLSFQLNEINQQPTTEERFTITLLVSNIDQTSTTSLSVSYLCNSCVDDGMSGRPQLSCR